MMTDDIKDKVFELKFYIQRNIRYNERRMSFFSRLNKLMTFLTIMLGSGTAITVISELNIQSIAIYFGIATAVIGAADLVIGTTNLIWTFKDLKRQYLDLEIEIFNLDDTVREKDISCIWAKIKRIEADEPPAMPMVEKLAENDTIKSIYRQDELKKYIRPIGPFKALTANIFYWDTSKCLSLYDKQQLEAS